MDILHKLLGEPEVKQKTTSVYVVTDWKKARSIFP